MYNKGLIITNGFVLWSGTKHMVLRLIEEFKKLNIEIDHKMNNEIFTFIDSDGNIKTSDLPYDFIIFLDKDLYVSTLLEKSGYRLFNKAEPIRFCDDKMLTHMLLANNNIKMPKTISCPLQYAPGDKKEFLDCLCNTLTFPFVVKEIYGSSGKQVHLVYTRTQLNELEKTLGYKPHIYQEYIKESSGTDYRIIVIGHKVVAHMRRQSTDDNEFRSNIETGGIGIIDELDPKFAKVAIKVSELLDLDYCGVDLLIGNDNEPILCEVNSNAFISGIEKYSGLNVAKEYALYIQKNIYK